MPKEKDTFEQDIRNYGKLHKSTMLPNTRKEKQNLIKATLQLTFGINRKQDNQFKTKQINLF